MREELFRLKTPLINSGLISALRYPESIGLEKVKSQVDLTDLSKLVDQLILENIKGSNLDARLVQCVHKTFKPLPSHVLTDMRMWHWLCVIRYPNIPWLRWRGSIPVDPEDGFTVGTGKKHVPSLRFLGTSSINGVLSPSFIGVCSLILFIIAPAIADITLTTDSVSEFKCLFVWSLFFIE